MRLARRWFVDLLFFPLVLLVGWTGAIIWFRLAIHGRTRVPRSGPVLLVSNHRSYLDPYVIHGATNRHMWYFMTNEYYDDSRLRWFYDLIGIIPVGGKHSGGDALREALRRLEEGEAIAIFPEGGVAYDGSMQSFHRGAAVLALRTGAPIVPVFISGTHESLPKGASFPRPGKVDVYVGEPFAVSKLTHEGITQDVVARLTAQIQERVAALGRAVIGDVPATRTSRTA